MARSFSSAKVVSHLISMAINRRGFAATAAAEQARGGAVRSANMKKRGEKMVKSTEKVSWVPDPRTGIYRPENVAEEIDVAELRAMLLKKQ